MGTSSGSEARKRGNHHDRDVFGLKISGEPADLRQPVLKCWIAMGVCCIEIAAQI